MLADPYGVVRYVAAHNLKKLPGFADFQYDFLAPENELKQQVRKAVDQWQAQAGPRSRAGDAILLDANSQITETKVQALLSQRDNRPVIIKE